MESSSDRLTYAGGAGFEHSVPTSLICSWIWVLREEEKILNRLSRSMAMCPSPREEEDD
jgi:hypothetical protein